MPHRQRKRGEMTTVHLQLGKVWGCPPPGGGIVDKQDRTRTMSSDEVGGGEGEELEAEEEEEDEEERAGRSSEQRAM